MNELMYSEDARKKLLSGFSLISKAVKTTLGPSGRNVLIKNDHERRPFSTKDGVTVAGQISSKDPIEQMAIESVQDITNNTDETAGDGTTTATVIAEAIFKQGLNIPRHLNLLDVKKGIDQTVTEVVRLLKDNAQNISEDAEKLKQVALVSCNGDKEIADLVYDAFEVAGNQGIVRIQRSKSYDSSMYSVEGMTLPSGYRSKYYVNNLEDESCHLENPWIYLTNKKISKLTPALEYLLTELSDKQESILIICPEMDPLISEVMIRNVMKNNIRMCVAKTPGFGNERDDLLFDMAIGLGVTPFMENSAVQFDDLAHKDIFKNLGRSEEAIITEHSLSIKRAFNKSEEEAEEIKKAMLHRADNLRAEIDKTLTTYEKGVLQARISRLSDGIAYINIGAKSTTEFLEKQARVQDALYAIKSGYQEGVIPGGGTALLSISSQLVLGSHTGNESTKYGSDIILKAIRQPFFQIIENVVGVAPARPEFTPTGFIEWVVYVYSSINNSFKKPVPLISKDEIKYCENNFLAGFDAKNKKVVPNMVSAGIVDPMKVTRTALENAASIAGMLLTTECVVYNMKANEYEKH